jgi:hypothetical protein
MMGVYIGIIVSDDQICIGDTYKDILKAFPKHEVNSN